MNYYSRKFLNSKKGIAAIECSADMESKWCNIGVKISDCNKTVNLDFDFNTVKDFKEKRAKLLLVISELQELRRMIDNKMAEPEFKKGMR
jgi:hypothetical protein